MTSQRPSTAEQAFACVIDFMEEHDCAAVFLIRGRLLLCRRGSPAYARTLAQQEEHLVGVYDLGADARWILDDLREVFQTQSGRLAHAEIGCSQ